MGAGWRHQPGSPFVGGPDRHRRSGPGSRGEATLNGASQTFPAIYSIPYGDFNDVTGGSNGNFKAGGGYDEVTGLGSPKATLLVPDLAAAGLATKLVVTAQPSGNVTAGSSFGLSVLIENASGGVETSFDGSVTCLAGKQPRRECTGGQTHRDGPERSCQSLRADTRPSRAPAMSC